MQLKYLLLKGRTLSRNGRSPAITTSNERMIRTLRGTFAPLMLHKLKFNCLKMKRVKLWGLSSLTSCYSCSCRSGRTFTWNCKLLIMLNLRDDWFLHLEQKNSLRTHCILEYLFNYSNGASGWISVLILLDLPQSVSREHSIDHWIVFRSVPTAD